VLQVLKKCFQKLVKRELAKNALLGDREQLRSVAASGTVRTCSAFVFDNFDNFKSLQFAAECSAATVAVHLRVITPDVHLLYNKQNFYKPDFLKLLYLDGGLFDAKEQIRFEISNLARYKF